MKATSNPVPPGNVVGSENFVPNPEPDHGYAITKGDDPYATAIAALSGENETPLPVFVGKFAGFENLVPNPELDHG